MNGQVVHFEIPADDVERAQAFYRDAFGWQINPMPEMQYTMVNTTPSGRARHAVGAGGDQRRHDAPAESGDLAGDHGER